MLPPLENVPDVGSKISLSLNCPAAFSPPAINTRPSARLVAVCPRRSVPMVVSGTCGVTSSEPLLQAESTRAALVSDGALSADVPVTNATAFAKHAWLNVPAADAPAAKVITKIGTTATSAAKRVKRIGFEKIAWIEWRSEERRVGKEG